MNNISKVCVCLFVRINTGFFVHAITKRDQPKKGTEKTKKFKKEIHIHTN